MPPQHRQPLLSMSRWGGCSVMAAAEFSGRTHSQADLRQIDAAPREARVRAGIRRKRLPPDANEIVDGRLQL